MIPEIGVSKITVDFIQCPKDEDRLKVQKFVADTLDNSLKIVLEAIAAKEGKQGDQKMIEILMKQHGKDSLLLTYRIMDELMMKEFRIHSLKDSN